MGNQLLLKEFKIPMQEIISRKEFLKNALRIFQVPQRDKVKDTDSFIYAPGIESESEFLNTCTQAYDCISKCPHEALLVYRENPEDKSYGFPVIKPDQAACYL